MPKSGSGKSPSRERGLRPRRPQPQHVPGVPGFPVRVTFALREPVRWLFLLSGLFLGAALAIPLWQYLGWRWSLVGGLSGLAIGAVAAFAVRQERCVESGCGTVLMRGVRVCPGCGGTIIGRLEAGSAAQND